MKLIVKIGFCLLLYTSYTTMTGAEKSKKTRSDIYRSDAPTFNDIEMPQLKKNKLSKMISDDRIGANFYIGQFGVFDDNVNLSKKNKKSGGAWVNVIGGRFSFTQPGSYDFTITPQVVFVPVGASEMRNFYTNIDATGNLKINEYIKTGISLGYNYMLDSLDGNSNDHSGGRSSIYIGGYVDITPTKNTGIKIASKLTNFRHALEGPDWDNYDAIEISAMPYWKFKTGLLGLKYTHGWKMFKESARGDQDWDEIVAVVEKELTKKIKVNSEAGFQTRRLDLNSNFNSFVGSFNVNYKPIDKVTIDFGGERRPYDATEYTGFDDVRNNSPLSSFEVDTRLKLKIVYIPIVDWKLMGKVSGSHIDARGGASNYTLVTTSISAVYSINEYLSCGASYIFKTQSGSSGYYDNMITAGMTLAF